MDTKETVLNKLLELGDYIKTFQTMSSPDQQRYYEDILEAVMEYIGHAQHAENT